MSALPTVRIKTHEGYAVVNQRDFDPETMALFESSLAQVETVPKKKSRQSKVLAPENQLEI